MRGQRMWDFSLGHGSVDPPKQLFDGGLSPRFQFTEIFAGYELGSSSIALLGGVGSGIYSKSGQCRCRTCQVRASTDGKEYDKRSPACIADDVKLFGASTAATCAALVLQVR